MPRCLFYAAGCWQGSLPRFGEQLYIYIFLGCQISFPEVVGTQCYPKKIEMLTKIIGYQKTSGKLISQTNKYILGLPTRCLNIL